MVNLRVLCNLLNDLEKLEGGLGVVYNTINTQNQNEPCKMGLNLILKVNLKDEGTQTYLYIQQPETCTM
ncbi:hypothetical protein MTR_0557s0010 [Medicago truncatula]|uniref:Uncharacterized protein n=1 Tax=Medicago truncatula TaxID=3880 RepID=A0A072TEY2_MEDTR|nr:hypothetical protein MTR_0557s0010 [Medicago truncatula]